jgi:hypothetical protein
VDEVMLQKLQAIATIGAGVVALHGITTKSWERRHSMFVGLGLAASVGMFLLPRAKSSDAPTADAG